MIVPGGTLIIKSLPFKHYICFFLSSPLRPYNAFCDENPLMCSCLRLLQSTSPPFHRPPSGPPLGTYFLDGKILLHFTTTRFNINFNDLQTLLLHLLNSVIFIILFTICLYYNSKQIIYGFY